MKKNVKNDKVIRAMAIGISAMLATSSPMTAMAAEGTPDTDGDDNISVVTPEEGVADAAQTAAKSASDEVNTAKDSATTVKDDVKDSVEAGEAGTDSEEKDLAQAVIDAAADVENTEVENGAPLAGATTAIVNTDTQLGVAEANDELSDAELSKAENASKDASDTAEELKDDMQKAEQKVDEQLDQIENAATVADADAAYTKLQETAQTAQADFDAKLEEYNTAKAAYDKAADKVKEYEDAYNTAIANADANAAEAEATLETAKANAAALEEAVETAKTAVEDSAKEAMVIAEAENVAKEDGGLNWRNEDKLFIAIMENYYLPEQLGITGATVTRVQGKDNDAYNYFKAEYVENGETKVKYFNYKMDGNSKDDIVIFEKREVEIFGGKADQYVDNNGYVIDTVAGLENGSVVDVNGAYVKKNDRTDSETFVSNSEITGTSKTDVTIDESTKQESYQLDEEGNLVKTVTGTVTTITYTDNTFTSQSYATDAERDAAAAAKEAKLEEATGKDATVNKTQETTHTYTANGTYIPTFTRTVNVNEEVEWKHTNKRTDFGVKTEEEAVEKVKTAEEKDLENTIRYDDDLYFLDVKSDLAVTGYTDERVILGVKDDRDFIVSGTVTATYAKVTKTTVDQRTVGSLWNDIKALLGRGQSTNKELEAAAKAAIEAKGGIFVSANWVDGNYDKATIRYVAGVKVETDEKQTKQAAKDAMLGAALQQAKAKEKDVTGVYNVKTNDTKKIEHTTYSYTVDYLEKVSETTENKTIATETYGNADVLEGQIIQNKNYLDGKILLTQNDTDYRAFVDDAKAITDKYVRLLGEAQQANADVLEAQKQVETLQNEIEALKGKSNNVDALTELTAKLETAKANRDTAEETLNTILEKLENAGVTRDQVIERLTPPAPTGGDGGQTGGETGGTPSGTTTVTGTVEASGVTVATTPTVPADAPTVAAGVANFTPAAATATTTPTVLADAPTVAAGVANFTPAAATTTTATADTVNITDEEVPLGASEEVEEEPQVEETVEINDEEVPLAAEVVEDEQNKMSWWWLLIVAILGATGYEMYRKHNQKKQKVAENTKETK